MKSFQESKPEELQNLKPISRQPLTVPAGCEGEMKPDTAYIVELNAAVPFSRGRFLVSEEIAHAE